MLFEATPDELVEPDEPVALLLLLAPSVSLLPLVPELLLLPLLVSLFEARDESLLRFVLL